MTKYIIRFEKKNKIFWKNQLSGHMHRIGLYKQGFQKKHNFYACFGFLKNSKETKKIYINKGYFYKWSCVNNNIPFFSKILKKNFFK